MTDITELDVEKAAQAIHESQLCFVHRPWSSETEGHKAFCRRDARAALSAVLPGALAAERARVLEGVADGSAGIIRSVFNCPSATDRDDSMDAALAEVADAIRAMGDTGRGRGR